MSTHNLPSEFVLVLGMHRSGTSALSNMLGAAGGSHGKWLQETDQNNPKGYGENARLVVFHDDVLRGQGSSWIDLRLPTVQKHGSAEFNQGLDEVLRIEFDGTCPAVIKDPRMCRLLPQWQQFLAGRSVDVKYVLTVRHPLEVADSLARRDGISREWAILSWLQHNLLAERHTRTAQRHVTSYNSILNEPSAEKARLMQFLDWPDTAGAATEICPELRHSSRHGESWESEHPLAQDVAALWDQAQRLFPPEGYAILDAIFDRYSQAMAVLPPESAFHPVLAKKDAELETSLLQQKYREMEIALATETRLRSEEAKTRSAEVQKLKEKLALASQGLEHARSTAKAADKNYQRLIKVVNRWNQRSWLTRARHTLQIPDKD